MEINTHTHFSDEITVKIILRNLIQACKFDDRLLYSASLLLRYIFLSPFTDELVFIEIEIKCVSGAQWRSPQLLRWIDIHADHQAFFSPIKMNNNNLHLKPPFNKFTAWELQSSYTDRFDWRQIIWYRIDITPWRNTHNFNCK